MLKTCIPTGTRKNRLLRQTGNQADNETDASEGFEML